MLVNVGFGSRLSLEILHDDFLGRQAYTSKNTNNNMEHQPMVANHSLMLRSKILEFSFFRDFAILGC